MRIYIYFSDRPNIAENTKKRIIQTNSHVEKGKRETKIMKRKKEEEEVDEEMSKNTRRNVRSEKCTMMRKEM